MEEVGNRREVGPVARAFVVAATLSAIAISVHQLFNLQLFGIVLLEGRYLYLLAGLFLATTFLCFRGTSDTRPGVPWYDAVLAAATIVCAGYFAWTAETSLEQGWEFAAPETARWFSVLFWLLILEGTRRAGGTVLFIIVLAFSLYPTVADKMPGPISAFSQPFWDTIPYHIISS